MSQPLMEGVQRIPAWLQWMIAIVLVSTFFSGWATTFLLLESNNDRGAAVSEITAETNDLGECLIEQLVLHRRDNRSSHESLSTQHDALSPRGVDLPPPLRGLPATREDAKDELLAACVKYLKVELNKGTQP